MPVNKPYTTQLQAGLGLIGETKTLLDLWTPGVSPSQLYARALGSGRFPTITARRLRNIVAECFAPRYLVADGAPALHLKRLAPAIATADLAQLFLIYTCRANPILADFIRDVYWQHYAAGSTHIDNDAARAFVQRGIDDGRTSKRWSDTTVRRVAAYLTGCCADYGLLERGMRSERRILAFQPATATVAYLAYDLHFRGIGDNAMLAHGDWDLFGVTREEVLEALKRWSLKGLLIVQAAGEVVQIGWVKKSMEALCDVIAEG